MSTSLRGSSAARRLAPALGMWILTGCTSDAGDRTGDAEHAAQVSPWRADARAAYSLIHDDFCDWTTFGLESHAIAELDARGLRAGFAAIGASCAEREYWVLLEAAVATGHELINHSMTHSHLTEPAVDLDVEIDAAARLMEDNVAGAVVQFFVFPFDEFDETTIAHLRSSGYLGARAGERGHNPPTLDDPLRLRFDAYGPDYSIYAEQVETGTVTDVLGKYVLDAIEGGTWAIRELHGVEDNSWEPVPLDAYQAHLDEVAAHVAAGALWMDTPTSITRYVLARRHCGTPEVRGRRLRFTGADPECSRVKAPLTVELAVDEELTGLSALQGGLRLTTRAKDESTALIVDVDPELEVELDFAGQYSAD